PNATQEEIEAALAKLDEEKANTLAAIDAATTNAGVDTARANGVEAILAVEVNPTAKQDAEKAIDDYAAQKIAEYQESLKGLSPDQTPTQDDQDAYIAAVKATAEAEKAKVESAFANGAHPDADTLSELVTDAKAEIDKVTPENNKKANAISAIGKIAADKLATITAENYPNATEEELQAARDAVDKEKEAAITAIKNATTNAGDDKAGENGAIAINNVQVNDKEKADANSRIEEILKKQIKQIKQTPDAKKEEIDAAIEEETKIAEEAKKAINNPDVNTTEEIAAIEKTAIQEIEKVTATPTSKEAARAEIDALAKAQTELIDNNKLLTDKEKAAAKDAIQKAVELAKSKIDNSDDNSAVDTAKTQGMNAIAEIVGTPTTPENAKNAIDAAAAAKIETINKRTDLTDEEKAEAIQAVDDALNKATNAIDNTSTIGGVDYYKEAGIDEINKIPTESTKKPAATAEIDKAAEDAKNTVDADSRLTDEEKQAAKEAIDKAAQAAKDAIDKDSIDAQVDADTDAGKKEIESLIPTASAKKDAADAEIDKAAEDAKKAVDADTQLTDEEKQAAKDAIDKDSTNAQVDEDTAAGKQAIEDLIPATSAKKDDAKAEIYKAAEDAKNTVDADKHLTDEEKQAAKDAIDKAAKTAKDAIDNETTNGAVDDATEAGKEAIKDLIPATSDKKDEAKAEIDKAAQDAKAEIDNNSYLSDDEKQAAKDAIDKAAQAAKDAIDASTTNAQVDAVTEAGKQAIKDL